MLRSTGLIKKSSRQMLALISIAVAITGCGNNKLGLSTPTRQITSKTEVISVSHGSVYVPPPPGFCSDPHSRKETATSVFLIFAPCANLGGTAKDNGSTYTLPGLMTASISKSVSFKNTNDIAVLSDYLDTADGRRTLSASGKSDNVQIVDKRVAPDGVFLHLEDSTARISKNVWKSFLNRSSHVVTVTLMQGAGTGLSDEQSMQFLQSYSETIRTSQTSEPTAQEPSPAIQPQPTRTKPKQSQNLKRVGIFRRLLL